MKRFAILFLLAVLTVAVFAAPVYAGVWGWFTNIAFDKLFGAVIAGIFALLSMFLGTKILKWRKVATEGKDFGIWLYNSTRESSPGGAKITGDELDDGLKEAGEFGVAIIEAVKKKE